MIPTILASTTESSNGISYFNDRPSFSGSGADSAPGMDTYRTVGASGALDTASTMAVWPLLLWASPAQPAEPAEPVIKIISKSGTYVDGRFTGEIKATMRIPNLDATLKVCTGEDISTYNKFPNVRESSYSNGRLSYVLGTDDVLFISVRDFGYSLSTATDRSQQSRGITKVTWQNAGTQPAVDRSGNKLTNFTENNGGWIFKKLPGNDGLYEVTWYTSSIVNPATLQTGSGMIPDSKIASETLINAEKVMRVLAAESAKL